jgi:hypothetical protein
MLGDWSAVSGIPMTVNVSGYGGNVSLFIIKVPSGDIDLTGNLGWDAGRKALEQWTGEVFRGEGRIVRQTTGHGAMHGRPTGKTRPPKR